MLEKESYVQVHSIELSPEERTGKIPEDTKEVPLESWVKGFLMSESEIGDKAKIRTLTGREVEGTVVSVNPTFDYGFGKIYIPELLEVGILLRKILKEEK